MTHLPSITSTLCLATLAVCLLSLFGCSTTGGGFGSSFSQPRHDYKVGNPYTVRGVTYTPRVDYNYDEIGMASWYSAGFHGRPTASGEKYNHNDLTAAHPTLPMPTIVRVTRLDNGRSVVVRINDRGPFVPGRIIDLSKRAAEALDMTRVGVARVRVQVLEAETKQLLARMGVPVEPQRMGRTVEATTPAATQSAQRTAQAGLATVAATASPAVGAARTATSMPVESAPAASSTQSVATPQAGGWVVQLGSFSTRQSAQNVLDQPFITTASRIQEADVGGRKFFRAQLGPFADRAEADRIREEMLNAGITGATVMTAR